MFLSKLDSLKNASRMICSRQKVTDVEEISIYDAHKRVLAEDITAFHDSPPFDKSAMDGFALIAEHHSQHLRNLKLLMQSVQGIFPPKKLEKTRRL